MISTLVDYAKLDLSLQQAFDSEKTFTEFIIIKIIVNEVKD